MSTLPANTDATSTAGAASTNPLPQTTDEPTPAVTAGQLENTETPAASGTETTTPTTPTIPKVKAAAKSAIKPTAKADKEVKAAKAEPKPKAPKAKAKAEPKPKAPKAKAEPKPKAPKAKAEPKPKKVRETKPEGERVRKPAKEAMELRGRYSFGGAFLRVVSEGTHHDVDKMIAFAAAGGLFSKKKPENFKHADAVRDFTDFKSKLTAAQADEKKTEALLNELRSVCKERAVLHRNADGTFNTDMLPRNFRLSAEETKETADK